MKATIDIPDDLYRRVKAKSALEGRPVRAVAIELFQRWLSEEARASRQLDDLVAVPSELAIEAHSRLAQEWLDEWLRIGEEAMRNAPPGPTAREILEEGRNRLERR